MTPQVDVDDVRLLVAIADDGSIGAAARGLGITQPAASARLRAFEARWRLHMVERSPRGSHLTVDGEAIVAWGRRVLHEVDLMAAGLEALTAKRQAGLTVAASLTVAEFLLPRWIGELRIQAPSVQPHLQVVNSQQVSQLVRSGAVDVGFIETAQLPGDLGVTLLGSDRVTVVVAPDHPWSRRSTPLTAVDLGDAHYVIREPGSGTRATFESALPCMPEVAFEAGSTAALIGAVLAGIGPAVVSARAVAPYVETGRLVEVPHQLDLWRPVAAVSNRSMRFNASAQALVRIAHRAVKRDREPHQG